MCHRNGADFSSLPVPNSKLAGRVFTDAPPSVCPPGLEKARLSTKERVEIGSKRNGKAKSDKCKFRESRSPLSWNSYMACGVIRRFDSRQRTGSSLPRVGRRKGRPPSLVLDTRRKLIRLEAPQGSPTFLFPMDISRGENKSVLRPVPMQLR